MNDLISRQAAIDLLKQMRKDGDMIPWEGKDVFARIRKLPSAQPDYKTDHGYMWLCPECGLAVHSDYTSCVRCGWERRTDE